MKKRLLSLALALIMIMSLLPIGAFAAEISVATQDELVSKAKNAQNGDVFVLGEGTFAVGPLQSVLNGKTVTFKGAGADKTTVYIGNGGYDGNGGHGSTIKANMTFEDLTLDDLASDSGYLTGFTEASGLTFKNVTFTHGFSNWGNKGGDVSFIGCKFNQTDATKYCVQELRSASGTKYLFDNCEFISAGCRFINAYKQGGSSASIEITVKNCSFTNTGKEVGKDYKDPKAAVNMKTGFGDGCNIVLYFEGNNTTTNIKDVEKDKTGNPLFNDNSTNGTVYKDGVEIWKNGKEISYVAQIGDTKYETLQAAVDASKSMEKATIVLLKDVEVAPSHLKKDYGALHLGNEYCCDGLTIDGNGHTIKLAANTFNYAYFTISVSNGNVNFKNLVVDANAGNTEANNHSVINFTNSKGTLENVTVKNAKGGWSAFNVNKSDLTLVNCTVTENVLQVISCDKGTVGTPSVATIKSGTYDGTIRTEGADQYNVLNIEGGTFTFEEVNTNDSGDPLKIDRAKGSIISITGGTFGFDPTDFVAVDYSAVKNEATGTWTVGKAAVVPTASEAIVTTEQKSTVDTKELDVDKEVKEEIAENTQVTGVELKPEVLAEIIEKSEAEVTEKTSVIEITVEVKAVPKELNNEEEGSKVAVFELTPVATVTVDGKDVEKDVPVSNDMLANDKDEPIIVNFYTGFKPVQVIHYGDDGFIETFNEGEFNYNPATKTCTVEIAHFSGMVAVDESKVAQIGEGDTAQRFATLAEAIAAAKDGETVTLLKNVDLGSTKLTVPAGKKITIDGDKYTISFSGNSAFNTMTGTTGLTVKDTVFQGSGNARYVVITGSNYSGSVSFDNCAFNDLAKCAVIMDPNGEAEAKLSITNCEYSNTPLGYSINMVGNDSQKLNIAVTFTGNTGVNTEFEIWKEAVVIDSNGKFVHQYDLTDVMAKTQSGDTVSMLKDSSTNVVLPEGVTFNTNGKNYTGTVTTVDGYVVKQIDDHTWGVEELPDVAQIGNVKYKSLAKAIAAANDGDTVTLLCNVTDGSGIQIPENIFASEGLTIDFDGHTYTAVGPAVGSSGTKNQVFQILKGNKITMKNGTVNVAKDNGTLFRFVIQNYSDLTLTGMKIDGTNLALPGKVCYTESNNYGSTTLGAGTVITAPEKGIAFDVYYYGDTTYPSVSVTVDGATINGNVEVAAAKSLGIADNCKLTLKSGTLNGDIAYEASAVGADITKASEFKANAPEGYAWDINGKLVKPLEAAKTAAIAEIEALVINETDAAIIEIANEAIAAINAENDVANIAELKAVAVKKITDKQFGSIRKEAIKELENSVGMNTSDAIKQIVIDYSARINNAKSVDEINRLLREGQKAIKDQSQSEHGFIGGLIMSFDFFHFADWLKAFINFVSNIKLFPDGDAMTIMTVFILDLVRSIFG